ncbi:transcription factor S [archaeon]|nr:transcription factor S [archaeon]|tara:strand:+ start:404 stop:718 length:315 start_codon:yes stop_codon:yes gene_type:complete
MEFCPKCEAILVPGDGKVQRCSCGYTSKKKAKTIVMTEQAKEEKEIEIMEDDSMTQTLPLTDVTCTKCMHKKAYYWLVQTRSADEPETRFFQCEKCKHRWRDYN